ncbi:MAG: sporulation protein YtfJ [Firmicutes bacterium]|nr:sporulation protein YtfJ [Bacillota bacterium]
MAEHPIQGLMATAMDSIKNMVDVNTVVGDPVETVDGSVIIPISRVSFGFAAGGGEYECISRRSESDAANQLPFAGGSGGGVTIHPVAFLVVGNEKVRLLPVDGRAFYDRLIDLAPELMDQIQSILATKTTPKHTSQRRV